MLPSYSRKAISGWTNHSGTVIRHKIDEKKMGNRGSKSVLKFTVKEQRVDGSWSNYSKLLLRCTLMGCESSYPVKIPSKQLNRLFFFYG